MGMTEQLPHGYNKCGLEVAACRRCPELCVHLHTLITALGDRHLTLEEGDH